MNHVLLISNLIKEDSSDHVTYAAKFCKHYKAKLHVLHIGKNLDPVLISSPYYYDSFKLNYQGNIKQKVSTKFRELTRDIIDSEWVDINIHHGNEEMVLKSFLHNNFIDFIITDNNLFKEDQDITKIRTLLFNNISTPLLVIPEYQVFSAIRKFNFLTNHTKQDIEVLKSLHSKFPKAGIGLTHLSDENISTEIKVKNEKWFTFVKSEVKKSLQYQVINHSIHSYIDHEKTRENLEYNAFVFTTHKRNFWKRFIDPSTTVGLLQKLKTPALVFKTEE
jgi:hypothetical protein